MRANSCAGRSVVVQLLLASIFIGNPAYAFCWLDLNYLNRASELNAVWMQPDTKVDHLASQSSLSGTGGQLSVGDIPFIHEGSCSWCAAIHVFPNYFTGASRNPFPRNLIFKRITQSYFSRGVEGSYIKHHIDCSGGQLPVLVCSGKDYISNDWTLRLKFPFVLNVLRVTVNYFGFLDPFIRYPLYEGRRIGFVQGLGLPNIFSDETSIPPVGNFVINKSSNLKNELIAKCNNLTLRVNLTSFSADSLAISRHGDFTIIPIKKNDTSGFELWPCRLTDEENQNKEIFHLRFNDDGSSFASFGSDTLTLTGFRVYISWDGTKWFQVMGIKNQFSQKIGSIPSSHISWIRTVLTNVLSGWPMNDRPSRVLSSVEEELPMTMQVGMVGTDGVLIASDTKWHVDPRVPRDKFWIGGRYSFNSPKIKLDRGRGIAVSQALNMETAGIVADRILADLKEEEFGDPVAFIEAIGEQVLETAEIGRREAGCLIALCKPQPQLFLFVFAATGEGRKGAICRKMESFAITGDNVNPAIFWAEAYYRKRPIKSLIPLAAHLIVSAETLNSGSISGLEIVFCDQSGFHRLSDESLSELSLKAHEWDKQIAGLFLNHTQQFSDAPNVVG
jgi:hypothetical protein